MIRPIVIYNDSILTLPGEEIDNTYENLSTLIEDMFETMYEASGIGLAAHQVGLPIKLFIIDLIPYKEGDETLKDFKKIFINAEIVEEEGEEFAATEGCLSIPGIHEEIKRKPKIRLKYLDENFVQHDEWFEGLAARCIQHEYDHTNGILFTKKISSFRRRLIQGKLNDIIKRNFLPNYKYKK